MHPPLRGTALGSARCPRNTVQPLWPQYVPGAARGTVATRAASSHRCLQLAAPTANPAPRLRRQLPARQVVARGAKSPVPKHQTWLAGGGCDAPDSPFHELKLTEAERNAGGAIGRRNYSFLTSPAGQAPPDVDWSELFDDPSLPLVADLGCGAGRYVLLAAQRGGPGRNYLGVDVHKALLDRANRWAEARGLHGHTAYLQANAVVSAGALLGSYPGRVELVSVQYPDPQERRQRHMVGRELVEALARTLQPGGRVYLASDFEDTCAFMRNAFEAFGAAAFGPDPLHASAPTFPCAPIDTAAAPLRSASFPAGPLPRAVVTEKPSDAAGRAAAGPPASTSAAAAAPEAAGLGWAERRRAARQAAAAVAGLGAVGSSGAATAVVAQDGGRGGIPVVGLAAARVAAGAEAGAGGAVSEGWEDEGDLLFFPAAWASAGWLADNPVGAPTEREVYIERVTGGRIYRALLVRKGGRTR
ncbi:hypothetical protein HYH03_000207 [Edaphochlamys debaryana]|uniref:tRNA (guanine(46)-N(7))-methyltransferase n=1 Tax=Edaphochlamys debaryana TaxID=47281 RepID=A0A835YFP7_9CHLO|nr:hypothetical protein HYH03_000207 [Edaphochlamys debaryana]|eukprot:KAG2501706.1 hypothetical protein HYH03_000207 [Edaphochlamys debaryana]